MLSDNSMHPFIPQNTLSFYHQTKYFHNLLFILKILYLLCPSAAYRNMESICAIKIYTKLYASSAAFAEVHVLRSAEAVLLCLTKTGERELSEEQRLYPATSAKTICFSLILAEKQVMNAEHRQLFEAEN